MGKVKLHGQIVNESRITVTTRTLWHHTPERVHIQFFTAKYLLQQSGRDYGLSRALGHHDKLE